MKNILFLGGDERSVTAFYSLQKSGFKTESIGLFKGDNADYGKADVIVLPIPSTKDGETVYCPLTDRKIYLDDIKKTAKGRLIITCKYDLGERCVDVLKSDGFAYLNAVPTAEGAIAYAINNTPFTLWKARVLIIGSGKVATVLKTRLSAFGCHLTVSARKFKDFALLDTQNIEYMNTADVCFNADKFDVIFNTVDAEIFPEPDKLKGTFLIDLSSRGCIDFDAVGEFDIKAVKLPGIPAKTAPVTAGNIYAETLKSVINSQIIGERI